MKGGIDTKKLGIAGKGYKPLLGRHETVVRQPKEGCLDFNNLPDNYLCSESKPQFTKSK